MLVQVCWCGGLESSCSSSLPEHRPSVDPYTIGIMEKKMETIILQGYNIGGYIGIMVAWHRDLIHPSCRADDYTVFLGTLSVATYRDCEAGQQSITGGKPFKPCLRIDVSSYACPHLVSGAVWDQKGCDLAGQCAWHQAFRSCTASLARFGSSGRSNAIPGTQR